ncbi:FG-GAP and VCBS repeat-containing protein [Actinoplanes awajinensis]|uniref:Integrin n=1 Tax=Actinoplanes awajinensis subsp. mycoplanecinus TaxID=135947 RepID=A0A0X3UM49_9ACTN|nr:FG-GAP-like repeat-containing protein [Actinoplanes awajinensis]KUL33719.1 hypothetical protein ADL15_17115 [Actinoplanes awajinensis subsp. mycoplanecinus]
MKFTRSMLVAAVATSTALATAPAEAASPVSSLEHRTTTALAGPAEIVRDGITLRHTRTPVPATRVTGKGPTRSDFDGDGRDDIATSGSAGVTVVYSSSPFRDQLSIGTPPGVLDCLCFGGEMVSGDFNGDGYDDLAAAASLEPDVQRLGRLAGAVWVIPGSSTGLRPTAVKHFTQSSAGVPGSSEEGDAFGAGMAAGDITGDGRADLAVSIPGKEIAGKRDAGAVVVLKGSAAGIASTGAQWLSQATKGVPGAPETGDRFGSGLAIGKIDKNRYQELVVGASQEDHNKATDEDLDESLAGSGLVTQFWGTARGVALTKVTTVSGMQVTRAVKQSGTHFWDLGDPAMAIGDTTGDGYGEIVIGSPMTRGSGMVVSLAGRRTGLSAKGAIALDQNSKGVAGANEDSDQFGRSLAVGDVTGDGRADVLTGIPSEGYGNDWEVGAVVLLRGSKKGLTGVGSQTINQATAGVPDSIGRGENFGYAVAIGNLNGSGGLDALIGAPWDMVNGNTTGYSSGSVTRLYGGAKGLGSGSMISGYTLGVGIGTNFGRALPS